jgi:acyl-homoserine lactone acylase PvdQ
MGYAFGWAQAHLHGTILLSLFGRGRGKASEYWGGSANLALDIYLWANRVPQLATEFYDQQDAESIALCENFASGFNDYVYSHQDEVSEDLLVVLPIDGLTVLQHGFHVLFLFTYAGADGMRTNFIENYNITSDPFYQKNVNATRHYASFHDYDLLHDVPIELREFLGSNAWAVNSPKTAPGVTAMLVANPHLPNLGFFRWTGTIFIYL